MPPSSAPRIGLALGSGAARGWAHLGVLRALGELGVAPSVVCGTSMGALVGGFYLSGYLDELEEWARQLTRLRMVRYLNVRLARQGLIAGHRLFAEIERYLAGLMIEDLGVRFASVATDLQTGQEVWLSEGPLVDAVKASFCLPTFFQPVRHGGRWLIDGALVNPVPVSVCRALGAQVVIAVNLNAGNVVRGYELRRPSRLPRLRRARRRPAAVVETADGGPEAGLRRPVPGDEWGTPGILAVMASTLNIVQDRVTRSRLAADPPDVSITPMVSHIGLLDFHRAIELIFAGGRAVRHAEAQLHTLLPAVERTP